MSYSMPEMTNKELEKIAKALRAALSLVEAKLEPIDVPEEVAAEVERKLANRICLAGDHQIEEDGCVIRGQCRTDYNTTEVRINRGELDERELILTGKLLAEGKEPHRSVQMDSKRAKRPPKPDEMEELRDEINKRTTDSP